MRRSLSVQSQPFHKTHVTLSDYDYARDIALRSFIATLQPQDILVLEEILYNPIQFPVEVLAKNLCLPEDIVDASLTKLQETNLFCLKNGQLIVCKDMRKYFESQVDQFDSDFRPDLNYMQQLLKKVPIEVLPSWYHISRASHQIFESIIEKYLLTPQLYRRYLKEQLSGDHALHQIMDAVFESPTLRVSVKYLQTHFKIPYEQLCEYILLLEFNFLGCLRFEITEEGIEQYVTPFAEWRDYLQFQKAHHPESIAESVTTPRPTEYAFCDDLAHLLQWGAIPLQNAHPLEISEETYQKLRQYFAGNSISRDYLLQLMHQGHTLALAQIDNDQWNPTPYAAEWVTFAPNMRAHFAFRHPSILSQYENTDLYWPIEKILLELERSLSNIVDAGWVYIEDFLASVPIALNEANKIQLRRSRQTWCYHRPQYNEADKAHLRQLISEYLYVSGIVRLGSTEQGNCFMLTELGRTCFSQNLEADT